MVHISRNNNDNSSDNLDIGPDGRATTPKAKEASRDMQCTEGVHRICGLCLIAIT